MSFDKLVEYFLKFPGIGPRQAKRFCYFLAGEEKEFSEQFAKLILEIKKGTTQCVSCFTLFENTSHSSASIKKCGICGNLNRDSSLLMAVEKDVDLENIEKSGVYNGNYFVLGGTLPLAGNGSAGNIRIKELFNKIKSANSNGTKKIEEIIIATSATIEGENTARYIEKILEPLKIKITRLGRGLSTGTELEYIDSDTMSNALNNRRSSQ